MLSLWHGQLGYQTAAEHVDDSHLATIFADYAKQRAAFVEELTAEVRRLDAGQPAKTGTVMERSSRLDEPEISPYRRWPRSHRGRV